MLGPVTIDKRKWGSFKLTQGKTSRGKILQGGYIFFLIFLKGKTLMSKDTVDAYKWHYNEWGTSS